MTKQSNVEFLSTKGFVKQYPMGKLVKAPETALFIHKLRAIASIVKLLVYNKQTKQTERKPINYDKLQRMKACVIIMVNMTDRGVLKYGARSWGAVQTIAAMGADEASEFDAMKDITDEKISVEESPTESQNEKEKKEEKESELEPESESESSTEEATEEPQLETSTEEATAENTD